MISTDNSGARPTMTMASQPQLLPAIAKPLLARESLMRSVSGLLLTTANFAEVVSGLPTSGLNAKTRGAAGIKRIEVRAACVEQQPDTEAAAADELSQDRIGQRHSFDAAVRHVDAEVAAVVTEGHVTLLRRRRGSARSPRPGEASPGR